MSQSLNKHLKCVLSSHQIENDEELIDSYRQKKNDLKDALNGYFGNKIFHPFDSGSYKKSTAINSKFDLDVALPFKNNGENLESIYDSVFNYFSEEYEDDDLMSKPKKQKVSIGIEFYLNGRMLDFDIVPGREINEYEEDRDLNLYVNSQMGQIDEKSYIKTNIHSQVDHIAEHEEARDVIKLLKVLRQNIGNTSLKSFLLELLTIRAFQDNLEDLPSDLWGKLKMTLEYTRDNIETIQLIDPGNSNNNVADSLNSYQKTSLSNTIKRVLDHIDNDESAVENYFPVNPDYPCEEGNKSPYILVGTNRPDRIPDNDFGLE